jgi:hypothetical protein
MRTKHNKKRNTAFLYEALVREATKALVNRHTKKGVVATALIKKYFRKGTPLYEELQLFKNIYETRGIDNISAQKILIESRQAYKGLDKKEIFRSQSFLIAEINRTLTKEVYNNFVPNYRSLATLQVLFSDATPIKSKILLENKLLNSMSESPQPLQEVKKVDKVVFKQFVKKYNQEYVNLLEEQKKILRLYMNSTPEGLLTFKSFLNEEMGRIETGLGKALDAKEIVEDEVMLENTKRVSNVLQEIKAKEIDEQSVIDILKMQKLVYEIQTDDD